MLISNGWISREIDANKLEQYKAKGYEKVEEKGAPKKTRKTKIAQESGE